MSTHSSTTFVADIAIGGQFLLFDAGMDLADIRDAREEIMRHAQAKNTVRTYGVSWRVFARWCAASGRQSLPATPDTVSLFIAWAVDKREPRYKLNNVKHICAAVRHQHRQLDLPDPNDSHVRATLAGAARAYDQEPGGKEAITPEQLRQAVAMLGTSARDVRDGAILLLGFASGWRSAELAGLYLREVSFSPRYMRILLRRSKTDQEGKGREVKIPRVPGSCLCPVAALESWVKVRGPQPGPLFLPFRGPSGLPEHHAIYPDLICHVVKRCLRQIGVDASSYGSHSLRSGMVTAASENGADPITIMQRTGHKRIETLVGYVRTAGGFLRDPLAGVL